MAKQAVALDLKSGVLRDVRVRVSFLVLMESHRSSAAPARLLSDALERVGFDASAFRRYTFIVDYLPCVLDDCLAF
jgi:hypothetical protein